MKDKKLLSALSYVDPKLIEEAMDASAPERRTAAPAFKNFMVACLCIVVSVTLFAIAMGRLRDKGAIKETVSPTFYSAPTEAYETPPMEWTGEQATEDMEFAPNCSMKVAMITDYGHISDGGYNEMAYEGSRAWCDANGADFTCFRPYADSTEARVAAIEMSMEHGYNILVLPGKVFAAAIVEIAELNPDITFIALDVEERDLQIAAGTSDPLSYVCPYNVFCVSYREEIAGFMAGVAAVRLGYRELGFLGSQAIPEITRYGYGFLQGADYAAGLTGAEVQVKFCYANQLYTDSELTAYMDRWYSEGTDVVFACGGNVYLSAAEAAGKAGGKVIGADFDRKREIDDTYGESMTLTSAEKALDTTIKWVLEEYHRGHIRILGESALLGIGSPTDPEENFVRLSDSTQWSEDFTVGDYAALSADIYNGVITVRDDSFPDILPVVTHITIDYQGNIKE